MTDILKFKNVYIYNNTIYSKESVPESTLDKKRFPLKLKLYSEIDFDKNCAIEKDGNCLYTTTPAGGYNIAHYFQDIFYILHSVISYPQSFNCEQFTDIIVPQIQQKGSFTAVQSYCLVLFQSLLSSRSNIKLNKLDHKTVYFYKDISFIIDIDRWMSFEVDGKNLVGEIRNNMLKLLRLQERSSNRETVIIHDSRVRGKDLINLDLLIDELNLKNYNVIVHNNFDNMLIKQQVQDYYNADILICPCGANIINCIFSKHIKKILCLGHKPSPKYHDICYWWTGTGNSISTFYKDIDISPEIYNIICKSTNEHIIKENINGGLVPNLVLDVPKILSYIES